MIIEQIELKNFKPYRDAKLDFSKSKDKNVTLIYGVNGSGKTSFFYAINWCFYGRKFDKKEIIPKRIRLEGTYLKNQLNENESTEVSVKIQFSDKNERYFLSRQFKVLKKSGVIETQADSVSLESHSKSGEYKKFEPEEEINRKINSLVPVTTREYFFFDGEKIDNFAKNDSEIKTSIKAVLGFDAIEFAQDYLKDARKHYDSQIQNKDENSDVANIMKMILECESKIAKYDECLKSLENEEKRSSEELNKLREKEKTYEQEKQNIEKLDQIKRDIEYGEKQNIEKLISLHDHLRQSYLSFSIKLNEKCRDLMKKWSDEKVFPSEKFNQDLITKTIEGCECIICGTKFEKDDSVYEKINSLKEDAIFNHEIEKKLSEFNGDIKDQITRGKSNYSQLEKTSERIEKVDKNIEDLTLKRDELEKKITKNITDAELKKTFDEKQKLEKETLPKLTEEISSNQRYKSNESDNLKKFKSAKKKIQLKDDIDQKHKKKSELCQDAEDAVKHLLDTYADKKRKDIDRLCRDLFKSLVWKKSHFQKIELTENYKLELKDKFGYLANSDMSAGERQVLSLAFITAIAKSSYKESPFIIDTPFSRFSEKPRESIAEQIPDKVPQLILFVTDTELTKKSEEIFKNKSDKIWKINFDQNSSISTIEEVKNARPTN